MEVNVHEAKTHFSRLLERVALGEEVIIAKAGKTDLSLSIASIWEILIKVQSGRLKFPRPAGPYVLSRLADNRIKTLSISIDHLLTFERLPMHHGDPFDRMLIAQSMEEDRPIITATRCSSRIPSR